MQLFSVSSCYLRSILLTDTILIVVNVEINFKNNKYFGIIFRC